MRELVQQDPLARHLAILEIVEPANNDFDKIAFVVAKRAVTSPAVELAATQPPLTW